MNILIVSLLILISILLVVLIAVLIKRKDKVEDEDEDKEEYIRNLKEGNFKNIKINVLTLPLEIDALSKNEVRDISRKILRIFESLEYKKNYNEYEKKSWHTWQVSMLLSLYKRDMELFIPNPQSIFRDEIIEQSKSSLDELVKKILTRYKKEVKVHLSKETLSKNRIWSGEEVSILMYYLSRYKN